jgi:hypothetical protein
LAVAEQVLLVELQDLVQMAQAAAVLVRLNLDGFQLLHLPLIPLALVD